MFLIEDGFVVVFVLEVGFAEALHHLPSVALLLLVVARIHCLVQHSLRFIVPLPDVLLCPADLPQLFLRPFVNSSHLFLVLFFCDFI